MFGKDQSVDSGGNNANVAIFARVHHCIHPPSTNSPQHQWFTAPKFTKFLQDVEGSTGVYIWVYVLQFSQPL